MNNGVSVAQLEQNAINESSIAKPKRRFKKLLKALLAAGVSLVALIFVARLIWRFSGSNQWEFVSERSGVKVYSLKAPGSDLTQVRGVLRVRSTLAGLVKFVLDPSVCPDFGCSGHLIDGDDKLQYVHSYVRYDYPWPFLPRELVMKVQVYQHPLTKEVTVWVAAAPDKVPRDKCCVRVTQMNNTWRYTPLGNGEVEVEYTMNMSEGGFMPDLLLNTWRPEAIFYALPKLQEVLNREKYQNAKFDYIKEL
ncbi:MAG TPA: hypothetical protein VIM99_06405 [Blastocatellia bacterium]